MSEQTRSPTIGETWNNAITGALGSVNTAIPGSVVRYDASTQLADVQPLIPHSYEDEGGDRQIERKPVVPNCPVQFPTAGGFVITFPVAVGDTGLLVFSQASLDRWQSGDGSEVSDPGFDHRHNITDGIFIPGVRAAGAPRQTQPTDAIHVGVDGGTFQGVGLGAEIRAKISELITCVNSKAGGTPCTPLTDPVHQFESQTVKVTP